MPGRNGNGPMGEGPMTGRGRGCCGGRNATEGAGKGGGRGHRHGARGSGRPAAELEPSSTRDLELADLKRQAQQLEAALGALKAQIQQVGPAATGREEE